MENISMTDKQIAEILAMNKMSKKQAAIDCLLNRYLNDISKKKSDINVLNEEENFYSKMMHSPKSYARWILNLTTDMIYVNISHNGFVNSIINYCDSYTEFKFHVFNHMGQMDCDKEISILISKNGIVADFDGEYASIARNRSNPSIWNAKISEGLVEYLPLAEKKQTGKTKAKLLKI